MNSSSDPSGTRPPDLAAARLAATAHSRYLRQLLAARPEVGAWLDDNAERPLTAERMGTFLAAATPASEEALRRSLRQ